MHEKYTANDKNTLSVVKVKTYCIIYVIQYITNSTSQGPAYSGGNN